MKVYAGKLGPIQQTTRKKWVRGRGWTNTITYEGRLAELTSTIQAMQGYCNDIDVEELTPLYARVSGQHQGFLDGVNDLNPQATETVWELQHNDMDVSIYECFSAEVIEAANPGAMATIRKWYQKWKDSDPDTTANPFPVPAAFTSYNTSYSYFGVNWDTRTMASTMLKMLFKGIDHVKIFRPVVSKQMLVPWNYNVAQSVPGLPIVYTTTTKLFNAIAYPAIFQLPAGQWLESPVAVRSTAEQRFEVRRQWEFASTFDSFLYTNQV